MQSNLYLIKLIVTVTRQRLTTQLCMHPSLRHQPFVSVWKANSQSEIIMAEGKLCLLSLPVLALSHAPRRSPNIHSKTRPCMNATLEAGRRRGDSPLCCCLVTAQLCSRSQAAVLISHIAILVSTHTAVGWRYRCHY